MQKTVYHRQIINGSPVPTFVIDKNHHITHWNRACEALTGLAARNIIGTSDQWKAFYDHPRALLADLILSETDETTILSLYEGRARKSTLIAGAYEAEKYFPALAGYVKWLFFTAAPLCDANGRIVGAIETLQDITDTNLAKENVQSLNRELELTVTELRDSLKLLHRTQRQLVQSEKMAALGGLVAGVAHEINTPVGISVTAASLLEEKTRECADSFATQTMKRSELESYIRLATESSKMILSNLRRASDLISSFKQVAVDQSCEEPLSFKLRECLDNIVMTFRPKLQKGSHTVTVLCSSDLELLSYAGVIGQIITNLIMNSLLHGFDGMQQGVIAIEVDEQADEIELRYSDNGNGIPQENLERIFEPFFTTRRNKGGTGLGLHILFNLVTQTLGGRIEFESHPNVATTFRIQIPRIAPSGRGAFFQTQPITNKG